MFHKFHLQLSSETKESVVIAGKGRVSSLRGVERSSVALQAVAVGLTAISAQDPRPTRVGQTCVPELNSNAAGPRPCFDRNRHPIQTQRIVCKSGFRGISECRIWKRCDRRAGSCPLLIRSFRGCKRLHATLHCACLQCTVRPEKQASGNAPDGLPRAKARARAGCPMLVLDWVVIFGPCAYSTQVLRLSRHQNHSLWLDVFWSARTAGKDCARARATKLAIHLQTPEERAWL